MQLDSRNQLSVQYYYLSPVNALASHPNMPTSATTNVAGTNSLLNHRLSTSQTAIAPMMTVGVRQDRERRDVNTESESV